MTFPETDTTRPPWLDTTEEYDAGGLGELALVLYSLAGGAALSVSWGYWRQYVSFDLLAWCAVVASGLLVLVAANCYRFPLPKSWPPKVVVPAFALGTGLLLGPAWLAVTRLYSALSLGVSDDGLNLLIALVSGAVGALVLAYPLLGLFQSCMRLACAPWRGNQAMLRHLLGLLLFGFGLGLLWGRLYLLIPALKVESWVMLAEFLPLAALALAAWYGLKRASDWPGEVPFWIAPVPSRTLAWSSAALVGMLAGALGALLWRSLPVLLPWPHYGLLVPMLALLAAFSAGLYSQPGASLEGASRTLSLRLAVFALLLAASLPLLPRLVSKAALYGEPVLFLACLAVPGIAAYLLGGVLAACAFKRDYELGLVNVYLALFAGAALGSAILFNQAVLPFFHLQGGFGLLVLLATLAALIWEGVHPAHQGRFSPWPLVLGAGVALLLLFAPRWNYQLLLHQPVQRQDQVAVHVSPRGVAVTLARRSGERLYWYNGEPVLKLTPEESTPSTFALALAILAGGDVSSPLFARTLCVSPDLPVSALKQSTFLCLDTAGPEAQAPARLAAGGFAWALEASDSTYSTVIVTELPLRAADGGGWELLPADYEAMAQHLPPTGVVVREMDLSRLDHSAFQRLCATFCTAFPGAELWFFNKHKVLLLGGKRYHGLSAQDVYDALIANSSLKGLLEQVGVNSVPALLACRLGKASEFAGEASPLSRAELATWRARLPESSLFTTLIKPHLAFEGVVDALATGDEHKRFDLLRELADFYWQRKLYEPALAARRAAWKLEPDNLLPAFELVEELLSLKRFPEAAEVLAEARKRSPRSTELDYLQGRYYAVQGQWAEAEQWFKRARDAAPGVAKYRQALWNSRRKQGKSPW